MATILEHAIAVSAGVVAAVLLAPYAKKILKNTPEQTKAQQNPQIQQQMSGITMHQQPKIDTFLKSA